MSDGFSASVTGVGLVTALGHTVSDTWHALAAGRHAIASRAEAIGGCQAGAPVVDLTAPADLRVPKHAKFMGRAALCGVRAALDAVALAGVGTGRVASESIGVYAATGETGLDVQEFFPALDVAWQEDAALDFRHLVGRASRLVDPYFSLRTLSNGTAALSAVELAARGPSINFVQGATAGAHALACACADLDERRVDAAVVIGCDALLTTASQLAYAREGVWSRLPPDRACRAFSGVNGDGFVPGEAGAALVLERTQEVAARGVRSLATIRGVGFAVTSPGPMSDAASAAPEREACARALAEAGGTADAGAVFAPGDPTPRGAWAEVAVLAALLGAAVPVTTLSGALGHLGAATSLVQVVLGLHSLAAGVPPAARVPLDHVGAAIDLVRDVPRPIPAGRTIVCLARSFSAEHAAIVLAGTDA